MNTTRTTAENILAAVAEALQGSATLEALEEASEALRYYVEYLQREGR